MNYSPDQLAIIALVMTFGSVVQGAVGFASGLLGVPLLVLCGFPLLEATVINFVSTSVQNATGVIQLRSHLKWADVAWPAVWRCVGLPLGILALDAANSLDPIRVQQIIGVVLLTIVALLVGTHVQPRDRLHPAWVALAFITSGMLMGFASIGGVQMVLYVNALTWSAAKSRAFLFACSSLIVPLMAAMLVWKFGAQAAQPAMAAAMVMPLVAVGLWIGLKLGHRLDKRRFRQFTYGLLVALAVAAIVSPWLRGASTSSSVIGPSPVEAAPTDPSAVGS